ncbi:MAG: efflux RND transporter periplasmic adaptor subunit [Gemmatimonadaceae bacterium]
MTPTSAKPPSGSPLDAGQRDISPVGGPRRRPVRVIALAALPLVAILVAWWVTRDATPAPTAGGHDHASMAMPGDSARPVTLTADQARRIGVTFAAVEASDMPREIRAVGQVTFDETGVTTISPKVDGWVERLYVDYTGRPVVRGEPLFAVHSPMLVTAQEELLLAHRLARDVAGGSAEARAGADDLVASARRRLAYWDVPADVIERVERTGQVQRTVTLRSPASGVVVEKNVTQGQRIMAGDALYRVADLGTVWVDGEIYEQDLRAVRQGQPAAAEFDAYPGERWTGRIAYVYPALSPETRTARIRVEIGNPGRRLMPGMYATLHVTGAGRAATLTVPRSAVLATGERQLVFVRRPDGRLEPRLVEVGATSDDRVEIIRGVSAGDTVVASATFLLDAESNLGTALGGMGDMPGMEFTLPPSTEPSAGAPAAPPMPGMEMPGTKAPAAPPVGGEPPPAAATPPGGANPTDSGHAGDHGGGGRGGGGRGGRGGQDHDGAR